MRLSSEIRCLNLAPLLAVLAYLCISGCAPTRDIYSDIRADRMTRYQTWRRERSDRDAEREVVAGPLSVERSILLALGNSRELKLALLDQDVAAATSMEAWSAAYPKLNLAASYTRLDMVSGFDVAPGVSATIGDRDNYSLDATVTQPLYRGGRTAAGIRAAEIYTLIADQSVRTTHQKVIFDVRKAYYDARLALELELASAEGIRVARRHLEDVRKNRKAGTASDFDVLRAEVELKSFIADNLADQNRYNRALPALFNIMGISQESKAQLADPLTYRPTEPDIEQAVRTAFLGHPDLLHSELLVRIQQEAVTVAKSGRYPVIDAFFTETYARPDPNDTTRIDWGDSWIAGVRLAYPLFQGFATRARVNKERLTLRKNEVLLQDTEERILLDIRQAVLTIADAAKAVESQQANIEQAVEALRLVDLGLKQGIRRQIEVLDAQRALVAARADYAQAAYAHELACLALQRATGTLEPPHPTPSRY